MAIKRSDVEFSGIDGWDRFVFEHKPTRHYYCIVDQLVGRDDDDIEEEAENLLVEAEHLYIKSPATFFDGEPSHSVNLED